MAQVLGSNCRMQHPVCVCVACRMKPQHLRYSPVLNLKIQSVAVIECDRVPVTVSVAMCLPSILHLHLGMWSL